MHVHVLNGHLLLSLPAMAVESFEQRRENSHGHSRYRTWVLGLRHSDLWPERNVLKTIGQARVRHPMLEIILAISSIRTAQRMKRGECRRLRAPSRLPRSRHRLLFWRQGAAMP